MPAELTPKQKMFADEYILTGNATQSYLKAYKCGIKAAESSSSEILRNPKVKEYIKYVNEKLEDDKIANMKEVKEFWTETLRNEYVERKDRLKASEYIAKTNAAFVEKVQHTAEIVIFEGEDDLED